MREVIRSFCAEFWKMKRSRIYLIHIFCPVIVSTLALLYFYASNWSEQDRALAYVQVIGMFFPMVASIVCAQNVELEEKGHFQTLLGVNAGKSIWSICSLISNFQRSYPWGSRSCSFFWRRCF